jgi:hypothetical protein
VDPDVNRFPSDDIPIPDPEVPEEVVYSGEIREDTLEEELPPKMGIDEAIANLGNLSQQNIFLTIAHFGKGIAAIASRHPEIATWVMQDFLAIREKLFAGSDIPRQEHDHVAEQLQEAQARTKGRKKKAQIRREIVERGCVRAATRPVNTCALCTGNHNIEDCPHFEAVREIRRVNAEQQRPGNARQCKVCLGWGHRAKTCQFRPTADS